MMRDFASNHSAVSHTPDNENSGLSIMLLRYRKTRKCLGSKAALMVLIWVFLVVLVYLFVIDLDSYRVLLLTNIQYFRIAKSSFPTVFVFFYPLAGLLADLKFGRYKVIIASLWMLVAGIPFVLLGCAFLVAMNHSHSEHKACLALAITGGILVVTGLLLFICSFVAFNANVIQFGLDQLHDSPAEDQVIFIKWYLWTYQTAALVFRLIVVAFNYGESVSWRSYYFTVGPVLTSIAVVLIGSLYITYHNHKWFFMDYRIINPYKLVYKVTKFARQHMVPVNRSAFTYCEDEVPSGLDLSKTKYGGPFSTEQVEDVKVLYGILRILFSLGPVFFLDFAVSTIFQIHIHEWTKQQSFGGLLKEVLLDVGLLYNLEVVLLYPLYIIILRPLVSYYIPRTRYKIGMGMLVYILVMLASLGMDVVMHEENPNLICMFNRNIADDISANSTFMTDPPFLASSFYYVIIIQQTAHVFSNVMIMTSMYEFIFSQCPHAMKGLIMGLSFTIIGIFKALGSLLIFPFVFYWGSTSKPSCGTVYYAANIAIGVVALVVYVCQAKRYKNRVRDEPCHVQRYVEEYYSKITEDHGYCDSY